MPQNKFFHDPSSSSNLIPDLSLHISLPNSAPSSICTGTNEGDSAFDIWRADAEGLKSSHSDGSIRGSPHKDTELSLANNNPTTPSEAESPWRRRNFVRAREEEVAAIRQTNHHHGVGVSSEEGGAVRPINGIPLYSNFSSLDNNNHNNNPLIERDPNKFSSLYAAAPYPSCVAGANSASSYNNGLIGGVEPISRFNGITMESLRPHHQQQFQYQYLNHQQQHQFGIGANSDFSNGFARSTMMPRLQSKRNMRAPRMRWTSSLHARFVHAVELLGGHESKSLSSLSFCQFHYPFLLCVCVFMLCIFLLDV